jgi:sodium/bile acid cotransporter 7
MSPELLLGFFYLCALPSTVSYSVALTVAARGHVPVALFNATLSALIGVLLTPCSRRWGACYLNDELHSVEPSLH